MKILVTGGAGFIGSHLTDRLLEKGHEVKVLDNLYSGDLQNLKKARKNPSFQFIEGDIRKEEDVEEALEDVDAVFHEAAITSVPASVKNPDLTKEVNIKGTENLLEESVSKEVERFIFASTCAVYGEPEDLPIDENSKLKPASPYADSKIAGEKKVSEYGDKEKIDTVILRYFNVYGPRQSGGRYAGVISNFLERLSKDEPPIIYGDGEQTRDFVYVQDIVRANLLALKAKKKSNQIFNIGSGKGISINELCETLLETLGKSDIEPVYKEARSGDIRHSKADPTKANEKLGYESKVSLREGLDRLIKFRGF